MYRSIRQGGVETPWHFHLVIKTIMAEVGHRWRHCEKDVPMLGQTTTSGSAYNLIVVVRSRALAQTST